MTVSSPGAERAAIALNTSAMLHRRRTVSRLAWITVVLGLFSALGTFVILAGYSPVEPTNEVKLGVYIANALIILTLLGLIAFEARQLYVARREGVAGSRLHIRVVALFSVIAAVPAIIISAVASVTLERGLNPPFFNGLRAFVLKTAGAVHDYRESQCDTLLREADLTAFDIDRGQLVFSANPEMFRDYFSVRVKFLGFATAAMIKRNGDIIERVDAGTPLRLIKPEDSDFADARQPHCLEQDEGRTYVVLRALSAYEDAYLYISKRVGQLASTEYSNEAAHQVAEVDHFDRERHTNVIVFATMYVLLAVIMLLSAVWLGLSFATQLVAPIRRLIHATDQVSSGNLYVQVPIQRGDGDLGSLGRTFNKMTSELRLQQNGLIAATALIDERRMFTEAVLSGVPAAVIGVDPGENITVVNPSARHLLGLGEAEVQEKVVGQPLAKVVPEIGPLLDEARAAGRAKTRPSQVTLVRNGRERIFNVRLTAAASDASAPGFVVTLDDITDLVSAQRTSAWADVARRIAHEIKNPLTPIQLSTERIKRKYGRVLTQDREVFDQCTDTIIRQVDDIKRMVDEFSAFARMPKATPQPDDVAECLRQVLFLMKVGHSDVEFEERLPTGPLVARFDRRLLSRAFNNIIKNATEGIEPRKEKDRRQGRVIVELQRLPDGQVAIDVIDNGIGFPAENRQRLLEPYMTTRKEGTGLGLPIVAKIMEEHNGRIELLDAPEVKTGGSGAWIRLSFPAGDIPNPAPRSGGADASPAVPEREATP